jgi:hypothetical protein
MNSDHIAAALLAGAFQLMGESSAKPLRRTAEGTPFVRFEVKTSELRGDCRVTTIHPAIAYGPTAVRIATTCRDGDMIVVSGALQAIPGCRFPSVSLVVKNTLRMSDVPVSATAPSLNVAYVVGTAHEATVTHLRDGTCATVLTVCCMSALPAQYVNQQTVILKGSMQEVARTVAAGDIIRVDGPIGLHGIGREDVWGFTCEHLRVLARFPEPTPLLHPMDGTLQRTA